MNTHTCGTSLADLGGGGAILPWPQLNFGVCPPCTVYQLGNFRRVTQKLFGAARRLQGIGGEMGREGMGEKGGDRGDVRVGRREEKERKAGVWPPFSTPGSASVI